MFAEYGMVAVEYKTSDGTAHTATAKERSPDAERVKTLTFLDAVATSWERYATAQPEHRDTALGIAANAQACIDLIHSGKHPPAFVGKAMKARRNREAWGVTFFKALAEERKGLVAASQGKAAEIDAARAEGVKAGTEEGRRQGRLIIRAAAMQATDANLCRALAHVRHGFAKDPEMLGIGEEIIGQEMRRRKWPDATCEQAWKLPIQTASEIEAGGVAVADKPTPQTPEEEWEAMHPDERARWISAAHYTAVRKRELRGVR